MLRRLLQPRLLVYIIIFFTILNSIVFVGIGIYFTVEGVLGMIQGDLNSDAHPGILILESLDVFLIALVFLIFAIGIAELFLPKGEKERFLKVPTWLDVKNFTELKLVLWEAVLTTLVVFFVSALIKQEDHYGWELLIIPISIILLSLSIFIIKKH